MRNPRILVLDRSEALAAQVRAAAGTLRPRPEVVAATQATEAADLLTDAGPFEVLVAGPSMGGRTGLNRLELIHDEFPGLSLVLALARRPDASLREVVRTGACDLLQLPVGDEELAAALGRAIELARRAAPVPDATAAPAPSPAASGTRPGKVFTVASATGGCGKTFYATNLAAFLRKHTGARVCIVDLDLQFGEIVTSLRLRPRYTIHDFLQHDDVDGEGPTDIEEFLVTHETGVHVLAAPRDPAEADRIAPRDVTKVLEELRARFDYVIVDTPAQLSEVVLASFDLSERLFVMATLDLPSVRNMGVFLTTLEKLKVPADNISLIINKAERDVGIDLAQIQRLFPQGFMSVLPYAKEVSRSINLGMPVLVSAPTAEISRRMAAGMAELLPPDQRARAGEAAQAAGGGRLARLFRRSQVSLVPQESR
jgi:pilus assembly protein CpaE